LLPQMAPPVGQPAVADQRKLLTDVLKELLDMKELLSKAAI
jgi:hypothetical protein